MVKTPRRKTGRFCIGVQDSGLALGTCRSLIACERGSAGSVGSTGSAGKVRRIKIMKRRGVSIALRAHRHFERSPQSSLQNDERCMFENRKAQHHGVVSPQGHVGC